MHHEEQGKLAKGPHRRAVDGGFLKAGYYGRVVIVDNNVRAGENWEPTLHSEFDGERLSKLDVIPNGMVNRDPRCEYMVDSWRLGRVIDG